MGRNDLLLVPVPHAQLQKWWEKMSESNKRFVRERIGYLVELIYIQPRVTLIQALANFWNASTASFTFGRHELTPTLEEYHSVMGVKFEPTMVRPPIGLDLLTELSQCLRVDVEDLGPILKKSRGKISLQFLMEKYTNMPKGAGDTTARAFILAFFGFVLFPSSKNTMDPIVACIARQACHKWDYSNMILAETVLSLNLYARNQREEVSEFRDDKPKTTFKGSAGLLYMWFAAHIKEFTYYTRCTPICAAINPLMTFRGAQERVPMNDYKQWCNFLLTLRPDEIRWVSPWPKIQEVLLESPRGDMVPLLGFKGATAYCPLRVTRQFGILQEIPPAWSAEPYECEFKYPLTSRIEVEAHWTKVKEIIEALKTTPKQVVEWPEEQLEGEVRDYFATRRYIAFIKARCPGIEVGESSKTKKKKALGGGATQAKKKLRLG